jgi:hypothetical protein
MNELNVDEVDDYIVAVISQATIRQRLSSRRNADSRGSDQIDHSSSSLLLPHPSLRLSKAQILLAVAGTRTVKLPSASPFWTCWLGSPWEIRLNCQSMFPTTTRARGHINARTQHSE